MSSAVTLSPGMPNPTLAGTINTYGEVGVFVVTEQGHENTLTLSASAYAPAGTNFSIDNTGLIESTATTGVPNFGVLLASTGSIRNGGTIENGVALLGVGDSGYAVNTGVILGNQYGVLAQNHAIVTNFGTINGNNAVYLTGGGTDYNFGGTIQGYVTGLAAAAALHGINTGLITVSGITGTGVDLRAGGNFANRKGGTIKADIAVYSASGTATNAGLIEGYGGRFDETTGADIGGALTNQAHGTIEGFIAVNLISNAMLINDGRIIGEGGLTGGTGIEGGSVVINNGIITGAEGFDGAGTVNFTNHGYVGGSLVFAILGAGYFNNTGTITGASEGVVLENGTLINSGLISSGTAGARIGVYATRQIHLTNAAGGTISGDIKGIDLAQYGTIYNYSVVISNQAAVYLAGTNDKDSGASTVLYNYGSLHGITFGVQSNYGTVEIYNYAAGRISGNTGIGIKSGIVYNAGTISGHKRAISLAKGGAVYNIGGVLSAYKTVISGGGTLNVVNSGLIESTATDGAGLHLHSGTITNTGTIAGNTGIIVTNGGTITDSGSVNGAGGIAISFAAGFTNVLDLTPGAKINGAIDLNGTLSLDAGRKVGTLNAGQVQNVTAFTIANAADWDILGGFTVAAINNDGTLDDNGAFTITGKLSGGGTIILGASGLTLNGAVATAQKIDFGGTAETLALGAPAEFDGKIQNFSFADTIDLTGLALSNLETMSFSHGKLTLAATTGTYEISFANPSLFTGETFSAFAAGAGTGITLASAGAVGLLTSHSPANPGLLAVTL